MLIESINEMVHICFPVNVDILFLLMVEHDLYMRDQFLANGLNKGHMNTDTIRSHFPLANE